MIGAQGSIGELGSLRSAIVVVQDGSTMQSEDSAASSSSNQKQPAPSAAVAAPSAAVAALHGAIVLEKATDRDFTPNKILCDNPSPGQTSMYFGNWGIRAANPKNEERRDVHDNNVAQIIKSPCHIVTLAEANDATLTDLKVGREPQSRRETGYNFDKRHEQKEGYYAFRGPDPDDVLVAVRRSVARDLLLLQSDSSFAHPYKDHGKQKVANARVLMCEIWFKQPIQHIGSYLGVAVVHLHYHIAKMSAGAIVYNQFWDRLAADLIRNNIKFLSGDFNMALSRVVPELRSRGVLADLCAWYPYWNNSGLEKFYMDSCGIFVIGGNAEVNPTWSAESMHMFKCPRSAPMHLPTFEGPHPGQSWVCYLPKNQSLEQVVGPMLQRNFQKPDIAANTSRTFLRVKQKELDRAIWELDGNVHKGAHFPLAIWTIGNSYRSANAAKRRAMKRTGRFRAEVSAGAEVAAPESTTAAEAVAVDNATAPANAVMSPDAAAFAATLLGVRVLQ